MIPTMKLIIFLLVLASRIQNPGASNDPDTNSEKDTETNIEVFNEKTTEKELTNSMTGSNKIPTWKIVVIVCFFFCVCIPLYWVLSVWAFLWQSSASFCVF